MVESSKSSGVGADEVYVSPWKFYESLEFSSDPLLHRKQKVMQMMTMMAHPKPHSAIISKKLVLTQSNELHRAMSTAITVLESVISSKKNQKPQPEDVDDTFGKLLVGQLKLIPECDLKDDFKISLQQMALRCKRQVNSSKNARQGQLASIATKSICYAKKFNAFICIPAVSTFKFEFPTKL